MLEECIVGIPTYKRYDLLDNVVNSFLECNPKHIYIINNGNKIYKHKDEKVTVIKAQYNLGVARSWDIIANLAFPHTIIIANDDILFSSDVIQDIINNPSHLVLSSEGFSLIKLTQFAYKTIGHFDTNFYPAYYEDNDYYIRAVKSGITIGRSELKMKHLGSSTIKTYDSAEREAFNNFFEKNKTYYVSKWGGLPGKETK